MKTYIPLAIAIILVGLLFRSCQENTNANKAIVSASDQATFWKDKAGRSNAEVEALKLDKQTFREYHELVVDSMKKQGIKIKHVDRIITINSITRDTVVLTNDRYADEWSSFTMEDSTLRYYIKDSLALITHHSKFGFLKLKSKYVTRATTFNPNTILTGIRSTEIYPKQRRINFGVYTGYGLSLNDGVLRPGPQVGVGLQVRIF
jgi:hypothetical protein